MTRKTTLILLVLMILLIIHNIALKRNLVRLRGITKVCRESFALENGIVNHIEKTSNIVIIRKVR